MKGSLCIKYATALCYTTRFSLTKETLLIWHSNDFVIGQFPLRVCWPREGWISRLQYSIKKLRKTCIFLTFSPSGSKDIDQCRFSTRYFVFSQLFFIKQIIMTTLSEMPCFRSSKFQQQTCGVVYSFTQPSAPRFHSAYISIESPLCQIISEP